jgi:hypothetical protein
LFTSTIDTYGLLRPLPSVAMFARRVARGGDRDPVDHAQRTEPRQFSSASIAVRLVASL